MHEQEEWNKVKDKGEDKIMWDVQNISMLAKEAWITIYMTLSSRREDSTILAIKGAAAIVRGTIVAVGP